MSLRNRFVGCIVGQAVGDALGSPVEGLSPEEIRRYYGGPIQGFVPPYNLDRHDGLHKGDGFVSDDTLMVLALCRAYLKKGGQLEAHDMATYFLEELVDRPTWIPELGREELLINRLFYPEKYLYLRLRLASVNPREAGVGNMVNCGAAMYAAPVGLMNACDPEEAYRRAIDIFGAHQWSYGREAAGLMAAAVAAAVRPGATPEEVAEAVLSLAKDGTRAALEAVLAAVESAPAEDLEAYLRRAIEPFDTVKGSVKDFNAVSRYPSQLHSIEELPIALAYFLLHQGEYVPAVLGAANYGRDADTIAGMAGALCGALKGEGAIPMEWKRHVLDANRLPLQEVAEELYELFIQVYRKEWEAAQRRHRELETETSGMIGDEGSEAAT